LGEKRTDIPKPTEETMAIAEPTGRSNKKERTSPLREKKIPNRGEKINIFLKS
jgi:hypothetical protein